MPVYLCATLRMNWVDQRVYVEITNCLWALNRNKQVLGVFLLLHPACLAALLAVALKPNPDFCQECMA
jgi:hypothetical protein